MGISILRISIIIFLLTSIAALYGLTLRAVPENIDSEHHLISRDPNKFGEILPFETSHPRAAYATLVSLAEDGTTELNKTLADFAAPDVGYYEGRFYSFFPPGVAALGLPFYFIGQSFNLSLAFAYASISLMGLAALFFVFLIARQVFLLPLWAALGTVLITAFTVPFWNHALTFYQHVPTVALITFAFYAAWRYKQRGSASWLWAVGVWTAYGVSTFFDYVNIVLFLPIIAYLLYSAFSIQSHERGLRIAIRSSVVITSLALVLLAGAHMFYNVQQFDNFKRFSNALALYERTNYQELQSSDTRAIAERKEQAISIFKEERIINGIRVLFFSFDKGLFVFAPVFLFSVCGIWTMRKRMNAEFVILLGIVAGTLLLYASFGDPWGGWSYGPRYLAPITWILALWCGAWLAGTSFRFLRASLVSIAFLFSAGAALLGILVRQVIPPKIEAEPLGLTWQYWEQFTRLASNSGNGSLAYNVAFRETIPLLGYFLILLGIIAMLTIIILFILPRFRYGN